MLKVADSDKEDKSVPRASEFHAGEEKFEAGDITVDKSGVLGHARSGRVCDSRRPSGICAPRGARPGRIITIVQIPYTHNPVTWFVPGLLCRPSFPPGVWLPLWGGGGCRLAPAPNPERVCCTCCPRGAHGPNSTLVSSGWNWEARRSSGICAFPRGYL